MSIQLDMESLDSAANQVSSISTNFSTELAALGVLVADTKSFWNDPAQVSFEAKYEQFKGSMMQFIEALNHYSAAMHNYAENQRGMVQSGAKMFESI